MAGTIDQFIINSPYAEPERHRKYDRESRTFSLTPGRRPAGYVIATADSKNFDDPGVFVPLEVPNQVRPRVDCMARSRLSRGTGVTERLLRHWRERETGAGHRFFFCQLEAIAIRFENTLVRSTGDMLPWFTSRPWEYAERSHILDEWVTAVNQQGGFGKWSWALAKTAGEVASVIPGRA